MLLLYYFTFLLAHCRSWLYSANQKGPNCFWERKNVGKMLATFRRHRYFDNIAKKGMPV